MQPIQTVELFAGVGGFRLGLEMASDRFQFTWANQWEPSMHEQYAFDCYTAHFGKSDSHVCMDIAKVKQMIPDHDLLVGGFPCQDYSIAKKGSKGIEGPKGTLWWQIDDIVRDKRPRYILLENVDRLIRSPSKQYGRDFSIILRCLYEKGYSVEWRVINAADYGQAQRRRRTFIVAYRNDTNLFKSYSESFCTHGLKAMHQHLTSNGVLAKAFPIQGHSKTYCESWIDPIEYENIEELSKKQKIYLYNAGTMMNGRVYSVDVVPKREPYIPLGDVILKEPVKERYFLQDPDIPQWIYLKGAKKEFRRRRDGSSYFFSEGSVAFPEPLELPSRTMLTSEGQIKRTTHVVKDIKTGNLRILTPVECERLNGFPDDWTNTGMPEKMRYFAMGNALVVPLVTRIGEELVKII